MKKILLLAAGLAAVATAARAQEPVCTFWSQLLADQGAPFVKFRAGKLDATGTAHGSLAPSKAFSCEYQAEDTTNGFTYPRTYSCSAGAGVEAAALKEYQSTMSQLAVCFPDLKFDEQVSENYGLTKTSTAKRPPFSIVVEVSYDKAAAAAGRAAGKLTLSASWKPPPSGQ